MRFLFLAALVVLPLFVGCSALQERADELEARMELLDQTLEAYGPIAELLGPEVQEAYDKLVSEYDKVQVAVAEGRELLALVLVLELEAKFVQLTIEAAR